jgi:hypothetical protein
MKTIADTIETLLEMGVTNSAIRAALLKKGFEAAEVEVAMPTAKRTCFVNDYFDWLATEARSLEEAREYILNPANSDNVRKYEKMHLNTAELALKIWAAK